MVNVSIGISQDLIVCRLIINVSVIITRRGYATYTEKQHHSISADLLASKWYIGLGKANYTLQNTTQDNVISDLKPLKWQYITYFVSQSLSRINFRFYRYTLFSKYKSVVGNTCAQIFTDGFFLNNSHEV